MLGTRSNTYEQGKPLSPADRDVERLRASLPEVPPVERPVLVVVSGLPGTGKSYFSRRIVSQVPLLVLESDVLRKVLFPDPEYTPSENRRLFRACHSLIDDLLGRKIPLLLDATNLVESHRESLYRIAEGRGAETIIVYMKAPPDVVYQRLEGRSKGVDLEDNSDADWRVYRRMRSAVQPIRRDHFEFDTSGDISPAVARVVQEIRRCMSTNSGHTIEVFCIVTPSDSEGSKVCACVVGSIARLFGFLPPRRTPLLGMTCIGVGLTGGRGLYSRNIDNQEAERTG